LQPMSKRPPKSSAEDPTTPAPQTTDSFGEAPQKPLSGAPLSGSISDWAAEIAEETEKPTPPSKSKIKDPSKLAELAPGAPGSSRRTARTDQVLLGVTGTGKTFTMAKVIEETQRPAHHPGPNKTLAAQLYGEFKGFFPDNAVEYFVSYYDYYQPEAYVPRTDTYIEKESSINEQIDRMRHSATRALLERDDVIIVASVSCIYGIGSVETYGAMTFRTCRSASASTSASSWPISSPSNTSATTGASSAAPSACAATRSRSSRPPGGPRLAAVLLRRRAGEITEFDPLTGEKTAS
jgi:hypothetical protein